MNEQQPPIEIPPDALRHEILEQVIESFVLREGTDYGFVEVAYERKILQIKKQIEKGEIKIFFDPNTETVNLISAKHAGKFV